MMLTCNAEHNIEGTVITQPKHADQVKYQLSVQMNLII